METGCAREFDLTHLTVEQNSKAAERAAMVDAFIERTGERGMIAML